MTQNMIAYFLQIQKEFIFDNFYLPPFDPKEAITSVNSVRNNGVQAEKYETSTVLSSLLVNSTKKTSRGTTRKLYPIKIFFA